MAHTNFVLNLTFVIKLFANLLFILYPSEALETFIVSFQSNGGLSTDQWMKHKGKLIGLDREFTVCHWERLRYVSSDASSVWSYCYIKTNSTSELRCWQLYYERNLETAGRNIWLSGRSPDWQFVAQVLSYQHREWNHFCWTYSSLCNQSRLYYNGKLIKEFTEGKFSSIENGDVILDSAFIIGQEPDLIGGGYDPEQLFNGEISELNVWSGIVDDVQISAAANCDQATRGDIIAWERQNFIINDADVTKLNENKFFCKERRKFIIFSQKMSFQRARTICDIHGGSVAIPNSEKDEEELLRLLEKHKQSCLDDHSSSNLQYSKAVWLGMERYKYKWNVADGKNHLQPINYTNWDTTRCISEECGSENLSCPYMQNNGRWAFGLTSGSCGTINLCTICSVTKTPVFTLKGVCTNMSQLDWNFYFITNNVNQIVGYDGYKTSKMIQNQSAWKVQDVGVTAETSSEYPIGRVQWNYIDHGCGMKIAAKTFLTLSRCDFGREFTCNSGQCLIMSKRCNKIDECDDKSDEENCILVDVPNSYNKIHSPEPGKGNDPIPLLSQVNVISVDVIDTLQMMIGVTVDIRIKWSDGRLYFENLDVTRKNLVPVETVDKLWLPLENIIHDNAILGEILEDTHRDVGITVLTGAMPMDITKSNENYIYEGSNTQLVMTKRFKIMYNCIFELSNFPFDKHKCKFIMKLKMGKDVSIAFAKDDPTILYQGPNMVNQFEIVNMTSKIINDLKTTNFIFSITINRVNMNQMLSTFLPTALLWFLAYFTLFIDIENFSDRFIGTVTALLVLVALLSSVNGDLPKTSYFKFIDLWFLWYIASILFIILFHIFLNHVPHNQIGNSSLIVRNVKEGNNSIVNSKAPSFKKVNRAMVNNVAIALFAITTATFDVLYFVLTA